MICQFSKEFERDLKGLDSRILKSVRQAIARAEAAVAPGDLNQLKKISGWPGLFRLRAGDYRLGVRIDGGTIFFMRCLHRREIYRVFP